ncbi:MAG: hypothetical protein RIR09_2429 [Pseudomonadota bacterium]|jgi:2-amino-4-hydroxy-6-hydroxymethyldihydropteridine diphosphokinase
MLGAVLAYIGLGANLGVPHDSVRAAMDAIAQLDGVVLTRKSSLYGSAPVDAVGADFVNAVVEVQTTRKPHDLLVVLQALELQAGRQRSYRNAPRTLDLDILLYGDLQIQSSDLVLPHPRIWERAFVLQPLAELIPDRVTPAHLAAVADQSVWRYPASI